MGNSERPRYWHVSPSVNRASIERHGLDWSRMDAVGGLASGADATPVPELDAVFLCESLDDVEFFVAFGAHPAVDVWEVDATGATIEPGPDGWALTRAPIPPDRVRLVQRDRDAEVRALSTVALVFRSGRLSVDDMTRLAGTEPDAAGAAGGPDGEDGDDSHAYWLIEGNDRYAPVAAQVAEVLRRAATFEAGLRALATACDEAVFVAYEHASELVDAELAPDARALLARIGVAVHTT